MWMVLALAVVFAVLTQLMIPTQKAKAGQFKDFDFPRIDDGSSVFYIAGRVRVNSPNLTWYGDFHSKAIKKKAGLFKKSTVGYKYFLGLQLMICLGPNVKLRKVWFGQADPGYVNDLGLVSGNFQMTDLGAFGGDTGGGGYDLKGTFYPGSTTQTADPYLVSQIGELVPGWRGLSYLVLNGYIGNSTQLQQASMEVESVPDPLGLGFRAIIGTEGDVNPANVIFDILTNNFGALGISPGTVNVQSFINGGIVFFDEDEGISVGFGGTTGQKVRDAFQDIMRQVDATLYEDPIDGQIYLKLIREDYVVADLPRLTASNISEMGSYAINLWSDTKNRVRVTYTDRSRDYKSDATVYAEDMANVAFQEQQVKAVTTEYPHIKRAAHATRVASRDLVIYSTPIANIRATSLRFDMNLRPGSVIVLDYPEYEISNLVLRVKKVDLGDLGNNRLLLDLTGDKFKRTDALYGVPGPSLWDRPNLGAVSITQAVTLESPRWFNQAQNDVRDPGAARVMALPKQPNTSQLSYSLYGRVVGEVSYGELDTEVAYPAWGSVQTSYPLSYDYDDAVGLELASLDDETVLTIATVDQITNEGANLILVDDEIMAFETFELNGDDRYVLKGIYRALLDTVPAAHSPGAKVIWLTADNVGQREFGDTDDVEVVMGSNAPRGAQSVATGVHMAVPEAL